LGHLATTHSKTYFLDEGSDSLEYVQPAGQLDKTERLDGMRPSIFSHSSKNRNIDMAEHYNAPYQDVIDYDLSDDVSYEFCLKASLNTKKFQNLDAYPYAFEEECDVLDWATALLTDSPLARALLINADKHNWAVQLTNLENGEYRLNGADKLIELNHHGLDVQTLGNSAFFRTTLLCSLMKALRDIWHEERLQNLETTYNPESILLIERARAADIDAISIIIGWELRSTDHQEIWRHMIGSEEGDMAQVLINILDRYPTALYNGMALAHIFRQWYTNIERIDACDHSILEHLDYLLMETETELGTEKATEQDFEHISTLPDTSCYLKELSDTVLRDPFFAGLGDPINQAHLFQIIYDNKVTQIDGVPFRDVSLAYKIFPSN